MKAANLPAHAADLAEIDTFCDALWLEDGLAKATLDSYRSDLGQLALWLARNAHEPVLDIRETTLTAFVAHLSRETRASSQARYLSTLRRFYRWQLGARPHRRRPDAEAGQSDPPLAPAQGDVGEAGRQPARRAGRRHRPRPARPRHAGNPLRHRPARFRTGQSETARNRFQRRRAARPRQGQQGTSGAARRTGHRLAAAAT